MSNYKQLASDIKYKGWSEQQIARLLEDLFSRGHQAGWNRAWNWHKFVLGRYKVQYNDMIQKTRRKIDDFILMTKSKEYQGRLRDILLWMDNHMIERRLYVSKREQV